MHAKQLQPDFAVSEQIDPKDMAAIKAQGFNSIICNRPDGETPGQPGFEAVSAAAEAEGIASAYLPLAPGQLTPALVEQFREAMVTLPKPILAYCRSGTRSATLWGLANSGQMPAEEIVKCAGNAGYDLSGLMARL